VDFIQSHLDFLIRHLLSVVFVAFLVEAAGLPFPSRILLLIAATLADEPGQRVGLVAVSTVGSLIGDHVPYVAGALSGPRILAFYCRITLGSAQCVEKTVGYFKTLDVVGTLLYTSFWVVVAYLVGDRAAEFLGRHGGARLLVLLGPAALAVLVAYRLWRRSRYGPAKADVVITESSCVEGR